MSWLLSIQRYQDGAVQYTYVDSPFVNSKLSKLEK